MSIEAALARWAVETRFEDLPPEVVDGMKLLVRTVIGTATAGATAPGCEATVALVREWGGRPEATIWFHGGKVPAHAAALANSTMARALDICDFQTPGQHIGTSIAPVALATAELVGGASGRELIAALAVGAEIASRLGVASRLDGFDPTGACSIFGACIAAGRILGLDANQMHHAMALTFNKAGSSFQSNIDASLAVRLIEGFISQDGIICAQLAQRGVTGPGRWLTGHWGYYHLFCKDERDDETVLGGLGERWFVNHFGYKTRPQCGATISSTDAILGLLQRRPFTADQVERIDVNLASPQTFHLVGSPFEVGEAPQVNGQFSVRYCVANAILRGRPQLRHFTPEAVCEAEIGALARRVHTHLRPELMEGKPQLAARAVLEITLKDGSVLTCSADSPSGFGTLGKSPQDHLEDFHVHAAYGGRPLKKDQAAYIVATVERLDDIADASILVGQLATEREDAMAIG